MLRLGAVFARGAVDGIHPLLGITQALRIEIEFLLIMAQAVNRFLQLHLRGLQHIQNVFQFGIVIEQIFQPRDHAVHLREARALGFGQGFHAELGRFDQACRVREP